MFIRERLFVCHRAGQAYVGDTGGLVGIDGGDFLGVEGGTVGGHCEDVDVLGSVGHVEGVVTVGVGGEFLLAVHHVYFEACFMLGVEVEVELHCRVFGYGFQHGCESFGAVHFA